MWMIKQLTFMAIGAKAILLVALFVPVTQGVTTYNTGAGTLYTLAAVADVTLERSSTNFNYLEYLIVSKLPQYPNKRSLVKFEALPSACPSAKIKSAKMYLYYVYAHKASWHSITFTPFIPRYMQVHLVKKDWRETEATSSRRYIGANWASPWLGLDGTDAEAVPQEWNPVTIFPLRPGGFVEFDITPAVRSWRSGVPNNGVVIRAVNELEAGRSIRFASKAYIKDSYTHPFARVLCAK
ncbi:uncharacterized protein [Montipora capricornis]|uniref:uncharacterized protein isoform X2 n=2 Tax=Montipora capricornis TaxID=246305 RepID=UPI0035F1693E